MANYQLLNPCPGGKDAHYAADSGCDIAAPKGTMVVAPCDGWLLYSEPGHTPWNKPPDTANSILMELAKPLEHEGHVYYYAWFTHLSYLKYYKADDGTRGRAVKAGEVLGKSGLGNNNAHLHFGILSDRAQDDGDFMLPATLAKLIFHPDAVTPTPDNPDYGIIKLFYHDGKTPKVSIEGILFDVVSIGPEGLKYKKEG